MNGSVSEVAPRIWVVPVRLPLVGLETVLTYALELGDGLLLVDAGFGDEESVASLDVGLRAIGASLAQVRGAVFTHAHADHYGSAAAVREHSGAWIALHEQELPYLRGPSSFETGREQWLTKWLAQTGADTADVEAILENDKARGRHTFPLPDVVLRDGERLNVRDWNLTVLHTPGHSAGHICIVEKDGEIVFTGDHLLSRTTPNISVSPQATDDPLGAYLRSLRRTERLGDRTGLAGHEACISSVAKRSAEIRQHHREQLAHALAIVGAGAQTIAEVAEQMPWSRPWERLSATERRAALAEGHAHLKTLERLRQITLVGQEPLRWSV
jgi:glyoxylase-like metal-dependent hydrolase (beta-lactamase superfamily II)